jgi:hypothetical protein
MSEAPRLLVRRGSSVAGDAATAVAELHEQIAAPELAGLLFFCSPRYDLAALARALEDRFHCPTAGCTAAGLIGANGFQAEGIAAVGLVSRELRMRPYLIQPLGRGPGPAMATIGRIRRDLAARAADRRAFGIILVDGLSLSEEWLTAALYRGLGDVPIVGGSAGDDLAFQRTHVYAEQRFHVDAAVFVAFETSLPFTTFKLQHCTPTATKMVITAADPPHRVVHEIDGEPAAEAYARAVGIPVERLDTQAFSKHPLMMRVDEDYYIRAVSRKNPDLSLTFFCAIEEGVVLTLGRPADAVSALERQLEQALARVPDARVVVGFDCVLRRLELEVDAVSGAAGALLAKANMIGFCTYGEQFNAIHVNQTLVGVVIGG